MAFIILNSAIFITLSALHFYWVFGGKWGISVAVPILENAKKMDPTPLMTFFVAFGLLLFATITIGNIGIFENMLNTEIFRIGNYVIAAIFFIRAIGDFKYVGLFRRVNSTDFGIYDRKYFTPLCLLIVINCVAIARLF